MSIALMTMVWRIEFPTQSQLLIALKLADHANDEGANVYPSRSRIADLTQCSETTVKGVLRAFREVGLLHVIEEGGKGPRSTTKYAFHVRLLHSLHRGDCRLVGGSDTLTIEWPDKGAEYDPSKGPELDPLEEIRGQSGKLRGQPDPAKGAEALPPNHQEPSSRNVTRGARASEDAHAPLQRTTQPTAMVTVRSGEAAFASWIEHLHKLGRGRLADWARDEGALRVPRRWPSGSDLPINNPKFEAEGLSDLTKRIIGEAAQ